MVTGKHIRLILLGLAAALVVAYLIIGVALPLSRPDTRACEELHIVLTDSARRYYVSEAELVSLLRSKGLYPVGQTMCSIDLDSIERTITFHPMIRHAECYKQSCPVVMLRASQRIPQLRVINETETYFIDSDRKRMPARPSVDARVMCIVGHVSERAARNELFDLVQWIMHDSYWRKHISRIEVNNPKDIRLCQADGPRILLGTPQRYEQKMNRLHTWYQSGADTLTATPYTELDLRYHRQVVARH